MGGYWGLFDSAHRALKYPPGLAISNYPNWKLQMTAGMVLAALVFAVAWLTLRRKPWTPRFTSWIAVGISATSAGALLGVAGDKMYYESYGVGGWLLWGFLLAAGVASPLFASHALMAGKSLPTFLELLGPSNYREPSVGGWNYRPGFGGDHGDRRRYGGRACLRSALQGFSVCGTDHGCGAVLAGEPAQSPERRRPSRSPRHPLPGCSSWPQSTQASTKARTTGSHSGPARSMSCWVLRCGGRGPRKSQDKQADREAG